MRENESNEVIIAYCGLCCTNCGMFKKEKCKGCHSDKPMNRNCEMKTCATERCYETCATCKDFKNFKQCKKLYNVISRFFGFIFRTDRIRSLNSIREMGLENFKQAKKSDNKA